MAHHIASVITSMIGARQQTDEITHSTERKKIRNDFINNSSQYMDKIQFINDTATSIPSTGVTIFDFYPLIINNNSKHQSKGVPNTITMYHNKYESLPSNGDENVNMLKNNFSSLINTILKSHELQTASMQMISRAKMFYDDHILRGIMYFLNHRNKFDLLRQLFLDSDDTYVFVYGLRTLNDNKLVLDKEIILLFDSDVSKTIMLEFTNEKPSYIAEQDNCVLYCVIESKLQYNPIIDNNIKSGFEIDINHLKSAELRKNNRRSVSIMSRQSTIVKKKRKRSSHEDDYFSNSEDECDRSRRRRRSPIRRSPSPSTPPPSLSDNYIYNRRLNKKNRKRDCSY